MDQPLGLEEIQREFDTHRHSIEIPDSRQVSNEDPPVVVDGNWVSSNDVEVVLSLANVRSSALSSELSLHLPLDNQENPAIDSSNSNNHGTVHGAVYTESTGDGSDSALYFDGDGDKVDVAPINIASNKITIAAWINADVFTGSSHDGRIVSKATGNSSNEHEFMLSTIRRGGDTLLRGRLKVDGITHTLIAISDSSMVTNRWYHVALVYDGKEIALFQDGVKVGSSSLSGTLDNNNNNIDVAIGAQPDGDKGWHGIIDDCLLYTSPSPRDQRGSRMPSSA